MLLQSAVLLTITIIPAVVCHRTHHSGDGELCPEKCVCYPWILRISPPNLEANCSKSTLNVLPPQFSPLIMSLKISFNEIQKISNDFFGHEKMKLMNVDFSNNSISIIEEKAFELLPELWIANFTGNRIEKLHHDTFQSNLKLWYLVLRGNKIDIKDHTILLNAPHLEKLDLSYNNIRALKDTTFSKMQSIIYLRLHNNQLRNLRSSWFQPIQKLERLYLEHNLLTHLDTDTFIHTPKLFELVLSWNNLVIPSSTPFLRVPNLEYLFMIGCDLGSIPPHIFELTPRLRILSLNSNRLTSLSKGLFDGLKSLRMFNACDNDFVCSCDLRELWKTFNYREIAAAVNCISDNQTETSKRSDSKIRSCDDSWDILVDMVCNVKNHTISTAEAQDQEAEDNSIVHLIGYVILCVVILFVIVASGGFVYWMFRSRRTMNTPAAQNMIYADMMPLNDERED